MSLLEFMGKHPILTFLLAIILVGGITDIATSSGRCHCSAVQVQPENN